MLSALALASGCAEQDPAETPPTQPSSASSESVPSAESTPQEGATAAATAEPNADSAPPQARESLAPAADAADPSRLAQLTASERAYEPPFPGRENAFQPPKQGPRSDRGDGASASDSVVLMGFAKLDVTKAVLAVDGVVSPLPIGGEAGGVRVISIEPPRAVLQRGRARWTASIE